MTGRFKQYTERYIDDQLMGQIEGLLQVQIGGQLGEQIQGQVDELLSGLLQGITEVNNIVIPVVEVESITHT
ncbi:hypothetical protein D3C78_1093850 [compost metagenome]